MTKQSHLNNNGQKKLTGLWLSKFTKPYYRLKDAGHNVELATLGGGRPAIDPGSLPGKYAAEKTYNSRFEADPQAQQAFNNAKKLADLKATDYQAVILPGGHGPVFDLAKSSVSQKFLAEVFDSGGIIAALCHGAAALIDVKLANGEYILKGRRATGFTNREERLIKDEKIEPFVLETKMRNRGVKFTSSSKSFDPKVVVDGRLITGQNPASTLAFADAILTELKKLKSKD